MFKKIFKEFDEKGILDLREINYKDKNYQVFLDLRNNGKLIITDDNCEIVKDKDILTTLSEIVKSKNSCASN